MKMLKYSLVLILGFVMASAIVTALSPSNVTVLNVVDSQRRTITDSAKSDNALAGNVTELLVNLTKVTDGWQGYYGNVTGTIVLDDASENSMYTWTITPSGEIYSTRNTSVNWTAGNIVCIGETRAIAENDYVFGTGANKGDGDNLTNTFTQTTHPAITTNANTINADDCNYSMSTYVSDASDAARTFNETLLWSTSDNGIIYTTILNNDQTGFTAEEYDFQMLVGEDGHGNTDTTAYYFFIEL